MDYIEFAEQIRDIVGIKPPNEIDEMIKEVQALKDEFPNALILIPILERIKLVDIDHRELYFSQVLENTKVIVKGDKKQCAI